MLFSGIVAFLLLPLVRADGWDDFSNNLATDLAPFLSLFGEQITKQYLSDSITILDYFIFAMAPMSIVTAVVSAVRVCGSPSVRAFIGRAQEGGGNVEAGLCSSTSRDVCELYNNGGIARVFGRPKILEVVYDLKHEDIDKGTAGIFTFEEYLEGKGKGKWRRKDEERLVAGLGKEQHQDNAEKGQQIEAPVAAFSPNLSLNIGIKKQPTYVFWAVGIGGLILQVGVFAFAIIVTYYLKWEKDGSRPESYACPLVIIGTLLLCIGMFFCAFLVGQSTDEEVWCREKSEQACFFWVQPGGQIIGDQTFDALCQSDSDDLRGHSMEYTISRKTSRAGNSEYKSSQNNQIFSPEVAVWAAVGITVTGFVLQFTGLRGIYSAVSLAQLAVTMVMSAARATLRMQRLTSDANSFANFPDQAIGHELDWLALRIGQEAILKHYPDPQQEVLDHRSQESQEQRSNRPSPSTHHRYLWRFYGLIQRRESVDSVQTLPIARMLPPTS